VTVLKTERLTLRKLTPEDAAFIFELVNQPSFIQNIGDRGVRSLEDAKKYILNGPVASYDKNGFGLYCVELRDGGIPIGICGLVKRDTLPEVDVGYAFLPRFWSKGYAVESAAAVMHHARAVLGLTRLVAIVSPGNDASIKVLARIGFAFERMIRMTDGAEELGLYVSEA
jgi:ribosomal-protein-alanine N-acetyltransferase